MAIEYAVTVFLIGVALSLDTFSVAAALGTRLQKGRGVLATSIFPAALFSAFHFFMPLLGYFAGVSAKQVVANIDHWIAFILLSVVGGKMALDSAPGTAKLGKTSGFSLAEYLSLAVATSIDALAIGMTIAFLGLPIVLSAAIIAATNFAITLSGAYFGHMFGKRLKEKAGLAGGVVLMGIGAKVLIEHLFFPPS
ncbi:MAG: manganese efflux pump MntP family protein [archaeon]